MSSSTRSQAPHNPAPPRRRSTRTSARSRSSCLTEEVQRSGPGESRLPPLVSLKEESRLPPLVSLTPLSPRQTRLPLSPRKRTGEENDCNLSANPLGSPPKQSRPSVVSPRRLGFDENCPALPPARLGPASPKQPLPPARLGPASPKQPLPPARLGPASPKQPLSPACRPAPSRRAETPSGSPSSSHRPGKKAPVVRLFTEKSRYQSVKQALHTAVPERLLSRETECAALRSFLDERVLQGRPASLYISGAPGTGKTACLNYVLQDRKEQLASVQTVVLNCMTLRSSQSIFPLLADKLGVSGSHSDAKLQKVLTSPGPAVLLVLDEMDQLDSRAHDVLYTIFEWPYLPKSRLCLIGIANALDLTDRILPRLQALPHCHPQLLHFCPYSRQELSAIVHDRLAQVSGEEVLDASAVQFCARKVSAVSGDARKALDICRRAVEMVESDDRKASEGQTPGRRVSVPQVARVLSEVYGERMAAGGEGQSLPLQQKLLVCCLLLLTTGNKNKEVNLGKLHEAYARLCAQRQVSSVGQSECLSLCSLLESHGVFSLKKSKEARLTKISLKIEERDVENALKDRALLGSMLAAGLP